VDYNNPRKEL